MFNVKKEILAHVKWAVFGENNKVRSRGIAGMKYIPAFERLCIKRLAGEVLPADLLLPVLDAALGEGWAEEAERLHLSRACPWRVGVRIGMSGARDYSLRVLADEEYKYVRVQGRLHVSMYGRLNEGVSMWLGDLPPLLAALSEEYPPLPAGSYTIETRIPKGGEGFRAPGESSGLLEVVEALRVEGAFKKLFGGEGDV